MANMKTKRTTRQSSSRILGTDFIRVVIALLMVPFLATSLIGRRRRKILNVLIVDRLSVCEAAISARDITTTLKSRIFQGDLK